MDVTGMASGPLVFAQWLREHSVKVHEAVELIQPLVDALLAQDRGKVAKLHGQMLRTVGEANPIKLTLYGQIKDVHFRSAGNYAFSEYIRSLGKVAEAAGEFADLLMVREIAIPLELHAAFQALVAHVVATSELTVNLAKELSSSEDAVSIHPPIQDPAGGLASITEGNCQVKQLGTEFARHLYSHKQRLDPVIILLLDRYAAALREMANAAECAVEHLRLMAE